MKQLDTIFIAGGAGYVGSKLVELALKKNYKVICFDKLVYGSKSIINFKKNKNFQFYEGDIRDKKKLEKIFKKKNIDFVVNLASIVGDKQCNTIPDSAYDINFNGNRILYEECLKKYNKVKKYIFASTCSNYGIVDPDKYVNERSDLSPVSIYAQTKVDCENYLKKKKKDKIQTIILRFATAYGISSRTRFDLTINSFTYEAIKYKKLHIFSKNTWRPFVHVSDMAEIILISLKLKNKNKISIYNAGYTKNNFSKQQIVNKILKTLKFKVSVEYIDAIIDRRDYRVNCDKIKKTFKLKNETPITKAINEIKSAIVKKKISEKEIKANLLDQNCLRLKKIFKK